MMEIARTGIVEKKRRNRWLIAAAAIVVVVAFVLIGLRMALVMASAIVFLVYEGGRLLGFL